jgi:hypothetical protein
LGYQAVAILGMHSRYEYEIHFYTPFGGKLIWLTFFGLQEPEVPAIIGSPDCDVLNRFSPSKEKDLF